MFALPSCVSVDALARLWRLVCVCLHFVNWLLLIDLAHGRLILVLIDRSLFSDISSSIAYIGNGIVARWGRCTIYRYLFGTPFLSMVSVCCWTVIVRYEPCALGSNLLNVSLSVGFALYVRIGSGVPCQQILFFCFDYRCFPHAFAVIVLLSLLRLGPSTANLFSHARQYCQWRIRNIRGDTLPDRSGAITYGKSNVVATGECLDSFNLYDEKPLHRWTCVLYMCVSA